MLRARLLTRAKHIQIMVSMRLFLTVALMLVTLFNAFAETKKFALIKNWDIRHYSQFLSGLNSGLEKLGADVVFDEYDMEDGLVDKIGSSGYDLVCTVGTGVTRIFKQELNDVPVVFSMVLNPVSTNIVSNMGASGSSLTGVALDVSVSDQLKLIKKIFSSAGKLGIIYSQHTAGLVEEARSVVAEYGMVINAVEVGSAIEVPLTIKALAPKIDVLWLVPDIDVCSKDSLSFILSYCRENKLPAMVFAPYLVKAGGIAAYSIDYKDIGRQTASVISKILIEGVAAGAIPIATPEKIDYVISLKNSEYFGIKISSRIIDDALEIYR